MKFNNILIPVAFDHDTAPVSAIELAETLLATGGTMTLVAVVEDLPSYVAEFSKVTPLDHIKAALKARLKEIAQGHPRLRAALLMGKPGVVIPDLAEETEADLVIVNSHRPDAQDYFLGGTASRVARRAPCSVLVLR